jgi:uncharacterized protein YbjT (DUF2867 family)
MQNAKIILVFGATGRMGGAAARHLHRDGWQVRAVTRNPQSAAAQALQAQGIDVVQGDMDAPESLRSAFQGAYGVFLVVNGWESGFDGEVRQGKHVADLAADAGIAHLVFAAAGIGERGTDIPHFDSKLDIEDYMKAKNIPLTMIFPPPFMELMTDTAFYPQAGTWNAKIKILGKDYCVPWIASDDIGGLASALFSEPEAFIGKRLMPVGDWKTLGECWQMYQDITGKKPPRWPMPVWMLRRMQPELIKMWEWMRDDNTLERSMFEPVASLYAGVTDVRTFLQRALSG